MQEADPVCDILGSEEQTRRLRDALAEISALQTKLEKSEAQKKKLKEHVEVLKAKAVATSELVKQFQKLQKENKSLKDQLAAAGGAKGKDSAATDQLALATRRWQQAEEELKRVKGAYTELDKKYQQALKVQGDQDAANSKKRLETQVVEMERKPPAAERKLVNRKGAVGKTEDVQVQVLEVHSLAMRVQQGLKDEQKERQQLQTKVTRQGLQLVKLENELQRLADQGANPKPQTYAGDSLESRSSPLLLEVNTGMELLRSKFAQWESSVDSRLSTLERHHYEVHDNLQKIAALSRSDVSDEVTSLRVEVQSLRSQVERSNSQAGVGSLNPQVKEVSPPPSSHLEYQHQMFVMMQRQIQNLQHQLQDEQQRSSMLMLEFNRWRTAFAPIAMLTGAAGVPAQDDSESQGVETYPRTREGSNDRPGCQVNNAPPLSKEGDRKWGVVSATPVAAQVPSVDVGGKRSRMGDLNLSTTSANHGDTSRVSPPPDRGGGDGLDGPGDPRAPHPSCRAPSGAIDSPCPVAHHGVDGDEPLAKRHCSASLNAAPIPEPPSGTLGSLTVSLIKEDVGVPNLTREEPLPDLLEGKPDGPPQSIGAAHPLKTIPSGPCKPKHCKGKDKEEPTSQLVVMSGQGNSRNTITSYPVAKLKGASLVKAVLCQMADHGAEDGQRGQVRATAEALLVALQQGQCLPEDVVEQWAEQLLHCAQHMLAEGSIGRLRDSPQPVQLRRLWLSQELGVERKWEDLIECIWLVDDLSRGTGAGIAVDKASISPRSMSASPRLPLLKIMLKHHLAELAMTPPVRSLGHRCAALAAVGQVCKREQDEGTLWDMASTLFLMCLGGSAGLLLLAAVLLEQWPEALHLGAPPPGLQSASWLSTTTCPLKIVMLGVLKELSTSKVQSGNISQVDAVGAQWLAAVLGGQSCRHAGTHRSPPTLVEAPCTTASRILSLALCHVTSGEGEGPSGVGIRLREWPKVFQAETSWWDDASTALLVVCSQQGWKWTYSEVLLPISEALRQVIPVDVKSKDQTGRRRKAVATEEPHKWCLARGFVHMVEVLGPCLFLRQHDSDDLGEVLKVAHQLCLYFTKLWRQLTGAQMPIMEEPRRNLAAGIVEVVLKMVLASHTPMAWLDEDSALNTSAKAERQCGDQDGATLEAQVEVGRFPLLEAFQLHWITVVEEWLSEAGAEGVLSAMSCKARGLLRQLVPAHS